MKKSYLKIFALSAAFVLSAANAFAGEPLKITLADDATNTGRALKLLEAAGLLKVDPATGFAPELKDITEYLYNIELIPSLAHTLPATLDDADGGVIGGSYGIPAGLYPSGALAVEGRGNGDNPFVCVLAARIADKGDPDYKKVLSAYQTQLVAEFMLEEWKEARWPAFDFNTQYTVPANFVESIREYKSSKDGKRVIRVGVCGSMNGQWSAVQKVLDERGDNIYIELIEFDSFPLPNEALNSGEIELNAFQHHAFLNKEIKANDYKITDIGETYLGPLGLYSRKYKTLEELKAAAPR